MVTEHMTLMKDILRLEWRKCLEIRFIKPAPLMWEVVGERNSYSFLMGIS